MSLEQAKSRVNSVAPEPDRSGYAFVHSIFTDTWVTFAAYNLLLQNS